MADVELHGAKPGDVEEMGHGGTFFFFFSLLSLLSSPSSMI